MTNHLTEADLEEIALRAILTGMDSDLSSYTADPDVDADEAADAIYADAADLAVEALEAEGVTGPRIEIAYAAADEWCLAKGVYA
jgi:hypothetical protein